MAEEKEEEVQTEGADLQENLSQPAAPWSWVDKCRPVPVSRCK